MIKDINDCHKVFLKYKDEFEKYKNQDLSESDTRSKIIDVIFTMVLDWDETQINREGYIVSGYFDYLFAIPGFKFIVEAKKDYVNFTIPTKHNSITIGTFEKDNKDVVSQIKRYLYEVGLQYAVITNGHQFIIGKFVNTDGSDWKTNKCLIFNGLDDIDSRFTVFYNILSKNSISENTGFSVYLEESVQKEGKTILSTLSEKDAELVRNSLSSELTPIIDKLFGELNSINETLNTELIKECFIENNEIKKNRSEIERLFADIPPPLEHIIPAKNTKNIVKQIQEEIVTDNLKFNINPPNPIVVIGSKGAGKTTFINYLFSNSNYTEQSHPHIYIDFRKYAELNDSFTNKIYADILEQIYEKYNQIELSTIKTLRSIYYKEIKRNDAGIWKYNLENNKNEYERTLSNFLEDKQKDNESHFFRLSEHLITSRRTRMCIIIDNADQFDIETQKKVFLFAQSINRKGNATIIISLREGYYYKLRQFPPFDAFACNVYHITAPPYKDVLQKRINYALAQIELEGQSSGSVGDKTFIIKNDNVRIFLLGLKSTLFDNQNSEILNFIQETTYPNIRAGLDIFKQFLTSGHTEVSEYILRYKQNEGGDQSLVIPYWEFIKAVGLDNRKYYNHDISIINNLFYPTKGNNNHFIKVKILSFLFDKLNKGGNSGKYYNVEELINEFVNVGYINKYLIAELEELCKWRLIETDEQLSDIEHSGSIKIDGSICISMKGHHYINSLLNKFSYIEMALEDTPIFDNDYFNGIKASFPLSDSNGKRNLKKRVEVVEKFIGYLESKEKSETVESQVLARNIVNAIKYGANKDMTRIKKKLAD